MSAKNITAEQLWALSRIAHSSARYVVGVDEVGLGALAGPIYVVGAVFLKGWGDPEVKDSKKFTGKNAHKNRHRVLVTKVLPAAVYHSVCTATIEEIDRDGVGAVLARLTKRAALNCVAAVDSAILVLDGLNHELTKTGIQGTEVVELPAADGLVPAVSAASIIAKTARDELMMTFDLQYPWYDFNSNMGYGTPKHMAAIERMGICPLHRRSYSPVQRSIAKRGPP